MLILVVLFLLVAFGVLALSLGLGLRWAKIPGVGWRRVLAATALIQAISVALALMGRAASDREIRVEFVIAAELVASMVVTLAALGAVFRVSPRRALIPWLATLGGSAGVVVLAMLVVNPYLFGSFTGASHAMAPTLLGLHRVATCPRCGGPAYASAGSPRDGGESSPVPAICGRCLRESEVTVGGPARPADRFLVDKLSTPGRWDVVVFRHPEDPAAQYVHRLVGLPGERVTIKDGAVWIDDRRQTPPIAGLTYLPEPGGYSSQAPGESPAGNWSLGPDEYFVLGDFSSRARDSRAWSSGAPGHAPFAVPGSHIAGVATYIYWPPSRWGRIR